MMHSNSGRTVSIPSEGSSLSSYALLSPPSSINPEPAYIAVSAASQLVSSELETDGVTISASALTQLNSFLDHILFNILLAAKSTKLSLVKPATQSVLKPKLGKAALAAADEELREYLGDDEDDDENLETNLDPGMQREFDLELAWKLARLRCMVYSRLGDLEEDDEDEYIERENLDERGGRPRRFSSHPSRVTTASAIFLTSVIEFLAEQALAHIAQVMRRKLSKSHAGQGNLDPTAALSFSSDRVVVSDADMRHLGLDGPLQKLWRGWRHQVRIPTDPTSRPIWPESPSVCGHSRKASMATLDATSAPEHQLSVAEVLHETNPARIPLPIAENDVNEIEIPGLASAHDSGFINNTYRRSSEQKLQRRRSLEPLSSPTAPVTPVLLTEGSHSSQVAETRPTVQHTRSRSLPTSPTLSPQGPSSNVVNRALHAPESLDKGAKVPDTNVGQEREQDMLPQGPESSDKSVGSIDEPRSFSIAGVAMPGSFPAGYSSNETEVGRAIDMSVAKVDKQLSELLPLSDRITPPDSLEAPTSSMALSTHATTTLEPALPIIAHPPRASSKVPNESALHNEQNYPIQLGTFTPAAAAQPEHTGAQPIALSQDIIGKSMGVPDETFPTTPTSEAQKRRGQAGFPSEYGETKTRSNSKSSRHTQGSSSSSKLLGFDREAKSTMPVASDRAGVQRVYPGAGAAQDVNDHVGRPSTPHSTKDSRPGTANSRISSLKQGNLTGASVDTPTSNGGSHKRNVEQHDKKARLDSLIQGEETLKYTLTPRTMREMEAPESPRRKSQTRELADIFKDTAPLGSVEPEAVRRKSSSPADGMNGLRASPPHSFAIQPSAAVAVDPFQLGINEQKPPLSPVSKFLRNQQQPRGPKVEKASTRDLADFAKSTGPESPGQLPKAVSSLTAEPVQPGQPKRAKSAAPRFLPRDPVVKGANSDLIDFIREGPPRAKGDGTHRIPRTVAPFRTTMDSDEFNSLGTPQNFDSPHSGSSNPGASVVTKSTVDSRTGLMDSTNRTALNPANSSSLGRAQVPKRASEASNQPMRKQTRVKDPYAIDVENDDGIDDGLGKPPRYGEESLIDFLRNTSPSTESQTQPQPLMLSTKTLASQSPNLLRKTTNGGFMERIKRTTSTHSLSRNGDARSSLQTSNRSHTSARPGNQLRPSSPHLVQSGSRFDSYKPTQTTYAAHVERNRQKTAAQGVDANNDEGGLAKFFSRKRRVAA
ncbi:hypothetical protein GJ744_007113 [Endocarpon pusillum]|uniref:Uncharacterized protein n=1 Tax=Endocarpon pusillum TaxID=364733 RepID=A0A8H7E4B5_9EURO|nr:hypothetical protein GJ744_007113 [Endocarpon pusillum]